MKLLDISYKRERVGGMLGTLSTILHGMANFIEKNSLGEIEYWVAVRKNSLFITKNKYHLPDDVSIIETIRCHSFEINSKSKEWFQQVGDQQVSDTFPAREWLRPDEYWFSLIPNSLKDNDWLVFVTKNINDIEEKHIEVKKIMAYPSELKSLKKKYKEEAIGEMRRRRIHQPGDVVYCSDPNGTHTALLLEVNNNVSTVLFLTSNPYWNIHSRQLSDDEVKHFGMPIRKKTYFALVENYPIEYLYSSNIKFPTDRLQILMKEFLEDIYKYKG